MHEGKGSEGNRYNLPEQRRDEQLRLTRLARRLSKDIESFARGRADIPGYDEAIRSSYRDGLFLGRLYEGHFMLIDGTEQVVLGIGDCSVCFVTRNTEREPELVLGIHLDEPSMPHLAEYVLNHPGEMLYTATIYKFRQSGRIAKESGIPLVVPDPRPNLLHEGARGVADYKLVRSEISDDEEYKLIGYCLQELAGRFRQVKR